MKRLLVNRIYQNELTKSKDIKYMYKRDTIEKVKLLETYEVEL